MQHKVCRYMMVVGTVPLVQKGHPHRELNPWRENRECRYMGVVGTHTGNHINTGNIGYIGIWRWLLPPIHGLAPTEGAQGM